MHRQSQSHHLYPQTSIKRKTIMTARSKKCNQQNTTPSAAQKCSLRSSFKLALEELPKNLFFKELRVKTPFLSQTPSREQQRRSPSFDEIIKSQDIQAFIKKIKAQPSRKSRPQERLAFMVDLYRIGLAREDSAIVVEALLQVAELCRLENAFDAAKQVLETALLFSLGSRNIQAELTIYDKLGFVLYQMRCLKECKYYHTKFAEGNTEDIESPLVKYSQCIVSGSMVARDIFDFDFLCGLYMPILSLQKTYPEFKVILNRLLDLPEFQKVELNFKEDKKKSTKRLRVRSFMNRSARLRH